MIVLGNTICNGPPTGYNGPEGGTCFYVFWAGHKIREDCTGGVKLFVFLGGEASCLFNVFEKGDEFVFKLGGGILGEHFVCVGVL